MEAVVTRGTADKVGVPAVRNQPGSDTGATVSGSPMRAILGDALAEMP